MANPNDVLMDALIRHAVYLGRYTKEQLSRVLGVLEGAHQGLILEVMRGTSKADQARLLDTIQQLYGPAMRTVAEQMTSDARELAAYEVERSGKLADSIGISFKMPAPTAVFDAVMASPADRGNTMKVLFDKFDRNTIDRISAVIRQGITEGLNPTAMVRALRGDVVKPARWIVQGGKKVLRPGVYRGGVYETTSRGAETLARTVTMHVYNTANAEVARENADLLSGVRWSATLDMDTCPDCAALDGQDWEVEDPHPEPPLHPNCRCVLVLQVRGHENADSPRFEDWLGRQSEERQNDILGVGRAEIFRSGATLSDMSDAGGLMTLAQLREKDLA